MRHSPPADLIPVLLMGVFHFTSRENVFNADVDDMLAPRRQAELDRLVEGLAGFEATKVLIEWACDDTGLADVYEAYRAGARPASANEREQIGFRLARRLGHDRIHGVDVTHRWFEPAVERLIAASPAHWATGERIRRDGEERTSALERSIATGTVASVLGEMNRPDAVADALVAHLRDWARLVEGDEYAGADMVGNWYHRNARIYANLLRIAEPGDRLAVIYGAGHIPVLRHLLEASGLFDLVDPEPFLAVDR